MDSTGGTVGADMTTETYPTRCTYSFDPDAWKESTGRPSKVSSDDVNEDGMWRCPHESKPSQEYCIFHQPPADKSDTAVRKAFTEQIAQSGKSAKQFIGARFGSLDLSFLTLESPDNYPIDLRHSTFTGVTTWKETIVAQPLYLGGARFQERANFNKCTFRSQLYSSDAQYTAGGWFNEVMFMQGGWFNNTTFSDAEFSFATFAETAAFREATFEHTNFHATQFEAEAEFNKAVFGHLKVTGCTFHGLTYFDNATFPQRATFRHSSFYELLSFDDLKVSDSSCYIELRDAELWGGRLPQPDTGHVLYDFHETTLKDVTLTEGPSDDLVLSQYRFLNTRFDGFDFGRYREAFIAAGWRLDRFDMVPGFDAEETLNPPHGALENTYLKAKNGANGIGDTDAAAEFFRKEMIFRRRQYSAQVRTRETRWGQIAAAFDWQANLLLDLTSGYGERPSRTILSSLTVIVGFTGLFSFFRPTQAYDHSLGYLLLSLESFIGLVLGGAEPITNPWVRLLASIEGFVGAFFIALFVFTLTRSIHR